MPSLSLPWRRWYTKILPAYWIFLFCATHFPGLDLREVPQQSDKLLHFVAFGALAFLYWRFCESTCKVLAPRFVWVSSAVLILYAGLDEYLQQFVKRGSDWGDFAADVVGIAATLAFLEWRRRRNVQLPSPAD